MKILAVDDDEYILELLPMILAEAGWNDVTLAPSASEALAKIKASPFDCLLLDIQMVGMDGIELCRRVRGLEGYRRTPIIMLTAMGERNFINLAFAAGATDYATKPFDINELGARVRIASELVLARREQEQIASIQDQGGVSAAFAQFGGVANVVEKAFLRNYLSRLSREGLLVVQIFSLKIDQFEPLVVRRKATDVTWAVTEVASAIEQAIGIYDCLISYDGNGMFVCSCNSPELLSGEELERRVQRAIDGTESRYDNGDRLDIEVSVGEPVRLRLRTLEHVDQMIAWTISRALQRSEDKKNAPKPPNIWSRRVN